MSFPQHWQPNAPSQTDDNLSFLVELLFSVMTWECDCHACTIRKGRASSALTYLVGTKLSVQQMADIISGQEQGELEPVPLTVVNVCRNALKSKRYGEDERAELAGWLESIGA